MKSARPVLEYRSHAKINLYLDVLRRRPDGYHDIETLFQTVSLCDRLWFETAPEGLELSCDGADLDCGPANIVNQAAAALMERAGVSRGVRIRLVKRIPVAAGLAGGSGNAAATLIALDALWELGIPRDELLALGARIGADVPYCMTGGAVAATGRGDVMEQLAPLSETWFILLHPPVPVSTAEVYNSPLLERSVETPVDGKTPSFLRAIDAVARGQVASAVFNRMESAVFPAQPVLASLRQRLLQEGCAAAAMSGSGPTLFGLCGSEGQARRIAARFHDVRLTIVTTVPHGVQHADCP